MKHPNEALPLSFSGLKAWARSPLHFWHYKTKPRTEGTPAMRRGTLVHLLTLEPERRDDLVRVDASTRAAKAYKEAVQEFGAERVYTGKELDEAQAIADAIYAHDTARELLSMAPNRERHTFWELDGLQMHGYPDAYGPKFVLDLKVTDPTPAKVQRAALDQLYNMQLGLYAHALDVRRAYIIAADPNPPHPVVVYKLSDAMLLDGVNRARVEARLWLSWADSYKPGDPLLSFDHYEHGDALELDLPTWHK